MSMDDVAAAASRRQAAREPGPPRLGHAEFPPGRPLLMVFRAHDVRETRQVLDMVAAIRGDLPPARAVRGLA